jgi:aspartate 4-decarboxylase
VLYSFSKFWGATGLRLGVVGLHASNALDERLAAAGGEDLAAACERYGAISTAPERLKLIDRMVADSRAVGLNHTAGLSTPQQVQMALFALDGLLDAGQARKQATRAIVARRWRLLFEGAGLQPPDEALHTRYYATLDVPALARTRYGDAFADWLLASFEPIDFVVRLAEERGIVLLDGGGFDAPRMSVRVSLANLPDEAYAPIGRAIVGLLGDYHARWRTERGGG